MSSAEDRIIEFLRANPGWFAAGELQRMEFRNKDNTIASPKAISRRLQENAEGDNALLEVEYRGKNHAFYRIKQSQVKPIYTYEEINGVMVERRIR